MSSYTSQDQDENPLFELSQNESRVLHSLVKWPSDPDNIIHSRISMKKSTFSSIKNRLKEQGYYRRYYIPNFPKLGFELSILLFGQLNRFTSFDERQRIAGDLLESFEEDIYQVSESNKTFHISISENYSEYAKNYQKFLLEYSRNKFLSKEGLETVAYPFEISRVMSFLDFESLLAKLFGFASDPYEERTTISTGPVKKAKLTKAQRKVLVGLIKYPDETDTLIADEVGVSRNTVANAKRKFLKKEILLPRVVPDLSLLGMKILNFTYRRFNPEISIEQRKDATELVRKLLAPHFYVSKNLDGYLISAHESFDEYNAAYDELMKHYMKQEYILDEPITYQLSIPDLKIGKEFDFLPLVMKNLGFDPDKPIAEQE